MRTRTDFPLLAGTVPSGACSRPGKTFQPRHRESNPLPYTKVGRFIRKPLFPCRLVFRGTLQCVQYRTEEGRHAYSGTGYPFPRQRSLEAGFVYIANIRVRFPVAFGALRHPRYDTDQEVWPSFYALRDHVRKHTGTVVSASIRWRCRTRVTGATG